ncbi:hypothetical protein EGW08_008075 [Elysia chlorotica]|uniref:Protein quiver n=1 Tax=Elysia chlorotica TaxID=188477 RepID=A0A3S1BI39_ELYCH|nr:hypothetical protein EGW08_008075 [Elysia chlorotica]
MCSSCRSDEYPKCEIDPPPPQPCKELGSGGVESCSTVRIFNEETGKLTQFLRSCSDSLKQETPCFNQRPGYKTCADICYTDGCNAAPSVSSPTSMHFARVLMGLFLTAFFVKLKNATC